MGGSKVADLSRAVFPNIFSIKETLKQFSYSHESLSMEKKKNKEVACSGWRLLQYFQLLDRKSCDISRDIWNFFFCRVSDSLFIHVTITRGTHNTVLWVPVWETIGYRVKYGVIVVCL